MCRPGVPGYLQRCGTAAAWSSFGTVTCATDTAWCCCAGSCLAFPGESALRGPKELPHSSGILLKDTLSTLTSGTAVGMLTLCYMQIQPWHQTAMSDPWCLALVLRAPADLAACGSRLPHHTSGSCRIRTWRLLRHFLAVAWQHTCAATGRNPSRLAAGTADLHVSSCCSLHGAQLEALDQAWTCALPGVWQTCTFRLNPTAPCGHLSQ